MIVYKMVTRKQSDYRGREIKIPAKRVAKRSEQKNYYNYASAI